MKIFDGRYSWDGKKRGDHDPIAWFPGAYDVKIVAFPDGEKGKVRHLKPFLCVYAKTGEGLSISAHPEKFAKEICRAFSLELEKVLWVEDTLSEADRFEVAVFKRSGHLAEEPLYRLEKRPATAGEVAMIERELRDLTKRRKQEDVKKNG